MSPRLDAPSIADIFPLAIAKAQDADQDAADAQDDDEEDTDDRRVSDRPSRTMFRNQYDTDVTVWSPQGHLHQIDYAMEAVKQGSACLGLTSKKLVVLCGIKRQNVDLAEHQKKVFKIDDHLGIAVAGLTADGRTLARYSLALFASAQVGICHILALDPIACDPLHVCYDLLLHAQYHD